MPRPLWHVPPVRALTASVLVRRFSSPCSKSSSLLACSVHRNRSMPKGGEERPAACVRKVAGRRGRPKVALAQWWCVHMVWHRRWHPGPTLAEPHRRRHGQAPPGKFMAHGSWQKPPTSTHGGNPMERVVLPPPPTPPACPPTTRSCSASSLIRVAICVSLSASLSTSCGVGVVGRGGEGRGQAGWEGRGGEGACRGWCGLQEELAVCCLCLDLIDCSSSATQDSTKSRHTRFLDSYT